MLFSSPSCVYIFFKWNIPKCIGVSQMHLNLLTRPLNYHGHWLEISPLSVQRLLSLCRPPAASCSFVNYHSKLALGAQRLQSFGSFACHCDWIILALNRRPLRLPILGRDCAWNSRDKPTSECLWVGRSRLHDTPRTHDNSAGLLVHPENSPWAPSGAYNHQEIAPETSLWSSALEVI